VVQDPDVTLQTLIIQVSTSPGICKSDQHYVILFVRRRSVHGEDFFLFFFRILENFESCNFDSLKVEFEIKDK